MISVVALLSFIVSNWITSVCLDIPANMLFILIAGSGIADSAGAW